MRAARVGVCRLAPATSAEDLAKKTEAAKPGEVDAFFSHSWRDEEHAPKTKFFQLMRWSRDYKPKHKRSPKVEQ